MRRSPLAAAAVLALLALAGCAAGPAASADPTPTAASTPTPTATPTVEATLVGPAELPPQVFGGDCGAAVDPAVLEQANGRSIGDVTEGDLRWSPSLRSAGGLSCDFSGGRLDILPRAGLADAELPAREHEYYFVNCDWTCAWVWETDALWISGSDWSAEDRSRAGMDAIAAAVGPHVAERWESLDEQPWTRDRTGWLPVIGCDAMAAAVGQQLGAQLNGQEVGYHDPPVPAVRMGDVASRVSWCALSAGEHTLAEVRSSAGDAWSAPRDESAVRVDLGVPGVTAFEAEGWAYLRGAGFQLTDGINVTFASVSEDGVEWTAQQIVTAIAAAAASDFQP